MHYFFQINPLCPGLQTFILFSLSLFFFLFDSSMFFPEIMQFLILWY